MLGSDGQERIREDFFTTVYDRSAKRYRYEFREGNPQSKVNRGCVVWRTDKAVKLWTNLRRNIETIEEVGLAIAAAVGISGEPTFLIPNLLTREEVPGRGFLDLEDLRITGKDQYNGHDCIKISGRYPSRSSLTVWIEANTSLILRVDEETAMTLVSGPRIKGVIMGTGPLVEKTMITYSPRVNIIIPAAKFEITIPEE